MKNKKLNSVLLVLAVFLITIAGSVVIIMFLNPKNDAQAVADYSNISNDALFSSEECGNVLNKGETFLNGFLGTPSDEMKNVTNSHPGDKTTVYKTASANYKKKSGGYICSWAQLWDNSVPAPRGIKIGDNYADVLKKYPQQLQKDKVYKPYDDEVEALQYRTLYGEYEATASYAVSVWDVNTKQSAAPVMLVYADAEAQIIYHFHVGQLECVEYSLL